ncbi:MAG: ATPase, T2SS/T4P/T4SS family [Giesbergeria sp.]|uniref:GspE/PulE family protein n=1 Tax=Giesbergeria sp. TaxID=2818473 RepID=UPI00261CD233|nr:ATPase, T2SS/T4P/T4SS family [Giesbergeria sp.]MDD2609463.1 ATPase, T2SS/T4P/T4SS family [Giesbergeria sp.]
MDLVNLFRKKNKEQEEESEVKKPSSSERQVSKAQGNKRFRIDGNDEIYERRSEGDGDGEESPALNVIQKMGEFPPHKDVLTHPNSSNVGLRIPLKMEDSIIAIKLDATRARIVYDPEFTDQVLPYVATIQSALSEVGLSTGGPPLYAVSSIIRAVRLNADQNTGANKSAVGSKSDGAKLFREWIQIAKEEKATDVHIRILDGGQAEVMMRVDGELEPISGADRGLFTARDALNAMKSAYEVLSDRHSNNMGTFSEASTLSSMIDAALGIPNVRLRFASLRGLYGPKAVVRLLSSNAGGKVMSFAEMGFAPSHVEMFERAQRLDAGAIGQMGVTGSGKTTAAKTFIETHPKYGSAAFYQVADPIEYPISQMHQIYVQRNLMTLNEAGKKDPYSEVIEALLRNDPDLVDVGEVRDLLSARAMANIAKSGHLSMFTLHVDSVAGAINRLTDPKVGLTREELTGGKMIGLLDYQALVPLLCPHCSQTKNELIFDLKRNGDPNSEREERYVTYLVDVMSKRFGLDPNILRWRNQNGCDHCRKRGTKGLTICAEVLMPDDEWLDFSAENKDRDAIRRWRHNYSDRNPVSENMNGKLVIEHALYKAHVGLIDPRSVERFGQLESLELLK